MKLIVDFLFLLVVGLPAALAGYLWMHIRAGWALGEYLFDKDTFMRIYGKKP